MMMRAMWLAAVLAAVLAAAPVAAQTAASGSGGDEPPNQFRVYNYDQPLAGWAEFNLWTSGVAASSRPYERFGAMGTVREGLVNHSAEIEYGLTDRVAVGGYLDFENEPESGRFRFTEGRLVARYRFANRQDLFFNPGVYLEYYIPRAGYGDQEVEGRIILDKDLQDFRVALNPRLSINTTGPDAGATPMAGFDGGIYYRRFSLIQPGLEYHAEFGKIGEWRNEKHYIEPSVDIGLGRQVVWHLGAAIGLNRYADDVVIQSIVTVELNAIRPSLLFGHRR